jgi:crotonobetainyl-CoA:carnitine CoA-transferase CaiB-like acyl-CoA transferase
MTPAPSGPLAGVRVLDLATLFAGPFAAMLLGDYGADVIKVEHPHGDPLRTHGHSKDGHGLMSKQVNRNKRAITLDLSKPKGQEILVRLASESDVLIENFRPGVLEGWNLGYDVLSAANPRLVMLRMTGFGQFGPYATRPGFGTLAEAMSGFAATTGEPDRPPTLPPFGLADCIAGLAGAFGVVNALFHRDHFGKGQVIDIAIIEPILAVLGNHALVYDQLGVVQPRTGNRTPNNAPRNAYRTRDGRWVAVSTSADRIATRVLQLVGHPEVTAEPWFASGHGRAAHVELLDELVGAWVAEHDFTDVVEQFERAGAAVAPIYDIRQAMQDPQYRALDTFITIKDEDLGPIKMQNVIFRMLGTPGQVRFPGRRLGQDNDATYGGLGLDVEALRREGVI